MCQRINIQKPAPQPSLLHFLVTVFSRDMQQAYSIF